MGAIFSKLWGGKCRTEDKNVPRQRSQKRSPAPGQSRDERRDSRVISVPPQSASKPAVAKPLSNQVAAADVAALDSVRLPNPVKPSTPQIYKTTFEQNLDDDLYEDVIDIDADIVDHELDQRNNDTDNGAETEAAVIKIQAGVRGFLARQNVKNIKRERSSEPEIPIHIEPEVDAIIVPPPEQFTDTVASSLSNAPEHSHDREIHLAGKVLESPETNKKFVVQPVVENVATVINVLNPSEVQAEGIKQIVEDKITEQIKPLGMVSSSLLSTEQPSSKAVDSVQAEVDASSPQTVSHTSTETVPEERQLIPEAISKVSEVVEPKLEELKTSLSESVEQIKDDVQNTFASAFHSNLSSIVTGSAPEKKSAVEVQQELEKDVNALSDTLKNDLQSHHQPAVVLTPEEPCSETGEFTSDAKKEETVVLATKNEDIESSNVVVSADDVTTLSSSDVTSSADASDSVEEPETAVQQEEVLSIIAKPVTLNQALPLEDAELDEPCELQLNQQPLQSKLESELLPEVSVTQDDDQLTLDNVQPLQEQEAAVRIQAAYRGFMTRKQIAQDQHEGRHDSSEANYGDAVESVSSIADSYLSDNSRLAEELNIRVTPEPEEAATKIQAAFRGYQVRKTLSREPSPLPTDEFQADSYQQEAETSAKSLLGGRTEGDLDAAEAETVAVLDKLEADLVNQLAA
ncbi:hypothetical protein HDE_01454 [Halotydeus destructor]|nr:hypothetical protein HDE_01454 [Halotydeus destructor]